MQKIIEETKKHAAPNTIVHCLYGYYGLGYTKSNLATLYNKDKGTISNWIQKYEETGHIERKSRKSKIFLKFSQEQREWVINLYKNNPVLFQREAVRLFFHEFHVAMSCSSVSKILKEANMTRKVLERRAIQLHLTDVVRFTKELCEIPWMLHNLVFLDEVSIDNTDMWRTRGYCVRGEKLCFRGEFSRKSRISLLCFCGLTGMINSYVTEGTFTRHIYLDCLRQFINDEHNGVMKYPGNQSIFIMDGARIHTDPNITLYLRSVGIIPLFLPAYAPMFNPIEVLFALMKKDLKALYVENAKEDPKIVVGRVLKRFANYNMKNLFKKSGYVANGVFNPGTGLSQDLT